MEGVEFRLLEYRPMAPRTAPHDRMVLGWRNPIESPLIWRSVAGCGLHAIEYEPENVTRQSDPPE